MSATSDAPGASNRTLRASCYNRPNRVTHPNTLSNGGTEMHRGVQTLLRLALALGISSLLGCGALLAQEHAEHAVPAKPKTARSEERRVGKECRSRWSP